MYFYVIPFSLAGGFFLASKTEFAAADFAILILYTALILYVMYKSGFRNLAWMALLLLLPGTASMYSSVLRGSNVKLLIVLLVLFSVLRSAGQLVYKKVLFEFTADGNKLKAASIDWYSIGSLFGAGAIIADVAGMQDPGWLRLVGPVCLSLFLFSQRRRVAGNRRIRIADTVWIVSLLLPLMPITLYLTRRVWKGFEKVDDKAEIAVLLFIFAVLFRDIWPTTTWPMPL